MCSTWASYSKFVAVLSRSSGIPSKARNRDIGKGTVESSVRQDPNCDTNAAHGKLYLPFHATLNFIRDNSSPNGNVS